MCRRDRLSKHQPVIFSSDSEDVISSEEMDKENIKKLENQTDIKVFRLTNRIRTNAELSTFIQNMMHLPPRMNSRGYPHIFVVYANDDVEAENLLSEMCIRDRLSVLCYNYSINKAYLQSYG